MSEPKIVLVYNGGGSLFGVPARDLTDADFKERSEEWREMGWDEVSLIGTGLYAYPAETKAKSKTKKEGGE